MPSAQDTAFSLLAQRAGLLSTEALKRAETIRRSYDSGEPLANVLVANKLLAPQAASNLLRQLIRATYVCERCGLRLGYDQLSSMKELSCPDCRVGLSLDKDSARLGSQASTPAVPDRHAQTVDDSDEARSLRETVTSGSDRQPKAADWNARATVRERPERDLRDTYRDPDSGRNAPGSAHGAPDSAHGGPLTSHGTYAGPGSAFGSHGPGAGPGSRQGADPARTLGEYTLIKELGRGASGVVYLAKRKGLERRFALKVLLDAEYADEETIARFRLEAAVCSKLDSPGIVRVYDVGRQDRHHYFAMEFCEGQTLRERISDGPLEPKQAATLISQLARALQDAHQAGVTHRDIKPANIILAADHPKLTDFGLARDRSLQHSLTKTGDLLGTPYYMAPELFREGAKNLTHSVDTFSLGVVLYEALTGQRPFQATTPIALAQQICHEQAKPPSSHQPGISGELDAICKLAMAKKPSDRYVDMREFADDLDLYLKGLSPLASQDNKRRRSMRARSARRPTRTHLLTVSAVVALALPAVTWFGVSRWRTSERLAEARALLEGPSSSREELKRAQELARGEAELLERVADKIRRLDVAERLADAQTLAERDPPPNVAIEARLDEVRALANGDRSILREVTAIRQQVAAKLALARARRLAKEPGFNEEVAKAFEHAIGLTLPPERSRLQLERVIYFYVHGRHEEASSLADALRNNRTVGLRAAFLRALALEELDRTDEALEEHRLLGDRDSGAIGLTSKAFVQVILGNANGAVELANQAVALDSSFPPTIRVQSLALFSAGHVNRAWDCLERIPEGAADWPRVLMLKAIIRSRQGRNREARIALDRMIEMAEPTPAAKALFQRGQALLVQGRGSDAITDFDRVLEANPKHVPSLVLRGMAHHMGKDLQRATADWKRAKETDELAFAKVMETISPRQLRDQILQAVGGGGQAAASEPLQIGSITPEALTHLNARAARAPEPARAALSEALRQAASARQWWEQAKAFDRARTAAPKSPVVALERARAATGRSAIKEARQAIANARKLEADPHELGRLKAELLVYEGHRARARKAFEAVTRADPAGVQGLCAAAEAALIAKDHPRAEAKARAALKIDPTHAPSMVTLILALEREPNEGLRVAKQAFDVEGALNARLLMANSLAGIRALMQGLLRGQMNPRGGMRIMMETQLLFELSGSVYTRLVLCEEVLRLRMPFPVPQLYLWVDQQLNAAKRVEPDRGEVYVLVGAMFLRADSGADRVLEAWEKAKSLDPSLDLRAWASAFRDRYGNSPRLDALLD